MPRTTSRHRGDAPRKGSSSLVQGSRRHAASRRNHTPGVVAVASLAITGVLGVEAAVGGQGSVTTGPTAAISIDEANVAKEVSRSAERLPLADVAIETSRLTDAAIEEAEARAAAEEKARKEAEAKAAAEAAIEDARQNPKAAAQAMLADYGWGAEQFTCLDSLWQGESGWNYTATNPSSGAYGIPQSLPASKMATAGADWQTNPITQITWGLGYIEDVYGTPCGANAFKRGAGWY